MNDRLHTRLTDDLARDLGRDLADSTTLPRLDARTRTALNRLHDERAAPLSFAWRGQTCRLQWLFETTTMPPHDVYRFRLGARTGVLGLDRPAQITLFGEPRLEALPRDLRAILLADAGHEIVEALMRATRLAFEWLPGDDATASAVHADEQAACFRITSATEPGTGWRGFVRFDDAAALAELVPPLAAPAAMRNGSAGDKLAGLRFPLRWQIGATPIRLREVRSIRPGDLVGVEEWQSAGTAIVATAELGGRRLVALAEGSRITIQQSRDRDSTMNRNPDSAPHDSAPQDAASPPLDHLDALEVTLRFEVGDLAVSLGELRNLRAGHVFELGQPLNRGEVRIVAHGHLLGKGYLVAVGERLGVRVSEFAPGQI